MSAIELILDAVAGELDWLEPEPVFLGGATIGLFLDAFGRSQLRPTEDVDCIVPAVLTRGAWWAFEEQLRNRGWSPDATGPICRYRSPSGTLVDLMTEDPEVLGFAGRWYPSAVATSERRQLVTGRRIRVPRAELLLACKLDAWNDRGKKDPLASKDLEDVVSLLDGCAELEAQVDIAPVELRDWLTAEFAEILGTASYLEAAIGQLPRGGDMAGRERKLLARMARFIRQAPGSTGPG